jgi:hypothetical protein
MTTPVYYILFIYKEKTMSIKYFFTLFIFLLFITGCDSQVVIYEGNLRHTGDHGDIVSDKYPFHVQEPVFFTITAECTRIDPVLAFSPSEGRGFEWDGADEGVLKYTGFFYGPETYDISIRAYHQGKISDPGFRITIEKPVVQQINPGEIVKADFSSESIHYSWYFEKLYVVDVEKPGLYRLTMTGEAKMKCRLAGRKLMAYLYIQEPGDKKSEEIEIKEKGRYGICIWYFEESEKTYTLLMESK